MAAKKKIAPVVAQHDPRAALHAAPFLSAAQRVVAALRDDLLSRADESPGVAAALHTQWEAETAAKRTGDSWEVWRRRVVVQIAAAWVLSLVFVRVLEDRGLLERNRVAGPGATDSQEQFRGLAPYLTDRDYLLTVFCELSNLPAAKDLFDPAHNPVWKLGPSIDGARALLDLFRAPNAETPAFRFGQSDTRFLGDLYQSLDEETQERFALLQTPHFVESYILDRTLERAIARFGVDDTTLIDPTCGSGHFLVGAFERLVEHRQRKEPGLDVREAARKALDAVYGADINPYAVAIARFRLTLAFLERGGYQRLAEAPALPIHLVVGDSLLHAPLQAHLGDVAGTPKAAWGGKEFALEDEDAAKDVLLRRYAAVVGNPPYITVKDPVLRERYREMYPRSAAGKYSLGAPFTERFFLLARPTGFVGTITANSFMKREFGKKLIEGFLPTVNVDGVVNTSGAYIPGHGTPTVLLFGTNEPKEGNDVLSVLAKRGEPNTPDDPARGLVWSSLVEHGGEVGFENDYISVARVPRTTLEKHPWSLGGGGAAELKELLQERASHTLADLAEAIGFGGILGEDEVYILPPGAALRWGLPKDAVAKLAVGEEIRDWTCIPADEVVLPYGVQETHSLDHLGRYGQILWLYRSLLAGVRGKGFKTKSEAGRPYYEYAMFYRERLFASRKIAFAFVATHNHFVLDRGGKVFNRSAPIIKLKAKATEEDHLALLAYLNSSTACFWMKQVFYPKASGIGDVSIEKGRPEANRYEFAGTQMAELPIPPFGDQERATLVGLAQRLVTLAAERAVLSPRRIVDAVSRGHAANDAARETEEVKARLLAEMKVLQEDIDWCVYCSFGLVPAFAGSSRAADGVVRPFEAIHNDEGLRSEWRQRVAWLRDSTNLQLIEDPVSKRLWEGRRGVFGHNVMSMDDEIRDAAGEWLADRAEAKLRLRTEAQSVNELRRELGADTPTERVRRSPGRWRN